MGGGGGGSDVFVWIFLKGHALIHSRKWEGHDFFRKKILNLYSTGLVVDAAHTQRCQWQNAGTQEASFCRVRFLAFPRTTLSKTVVFDWLSLWQNACTQEASFTNSV